MFSTVINEAEIKAVFSIKEPEDAQYLVRLLYRGGVIDEQVFVLADDLASMPTQYGVISIGGRLCLKFRALDAPMKKSIQRHSRII